ncbi:MAG TPA: trypsin-like peptidase domain-containing protein, partial [Micromonosporaceae bacterium]
MSEHDTDPLRRPDPHGDQSAQPTSELPRVDHGEPAATAPDPTPRSDPSGQTGPEAQSGNGPEGPTVSGPGTPSSPSSMPAQWSYGAGQQPGWTAADQAAYGQVPYQPHPHTAPLPPWAYPATPQPQRPGRLGKLVAGSALALVLMAGSGVAGGLVTLAVTGEPAPTKTFAAAPIINSADLPAIAASVQNSVVSIRTGSGEGSGVVLSADGYVLTNNHVVETAEGETVTVLFANGESAKARIVGTDPKTDLAVVKAQNVSGLTAAKLGDSDAMRVGDTVLALGSPLGLQGSVTAGIISARDRTIRA